MIRIDPRRQDQVSQFLQSLENVPIWGPLSQKGLQARSFHPDTGARLPRRSLLSLDGGRRCHSHIAIGSPPLSRAVGRLCLRMLLRQLFREISRIARTALELLLALLGTEGRRQGLVRLKSAKRPVSPRRRRDRKCLEADL